MLLHPTRGAAAAAQAAALPPLLLLEVLPLREGCRQGRICWALAVQPQQPFVDLCLRGVGERGELGGGEQRWVEMGAGELSHGRECAALR